MKNIAILAGDGIGPEIMAQGLKVLDKAQELFQLDFAYHPYVIGGAAIDEKGTPLPEETLAGCRTSDAILLAAIGGPKWDDAPERPEQGLLALRKALALYANIRPITVSRHTAHLSPLKEAIVVGSDFVVVRELTGGIYFGEPRELIDSQAVDTCVYRAEEIRRIMRKAFSIARTRRKKVTSVDKSNVLATSKLWRRIAEEVALEFPDVTLEHQLVDSAAMVLITKPTVFDVIVTENMFGDILSDEASVIPGSLGLLPSASHSEDGPSLYEPIHGSAPDIAGQDIANPLSMIYSITMMLRQSFSLHEAADCIEAACDSVMAQGIITKDLGGTAATSQFTEAVIQQMTLKRGG
ncbi:3-isopropylmalate dehydrogenase [Vagococcus acidifermentans]|uniref:3-isopropylmalate dehydrogenase n=1 Tax=Vagococcus acidifermentans TaxID=564710 RepID=A0A430ASF5_9ENTE|nr:3-isopropylmalate dehydrogenase [Vagococcus acidifermentans]RSU10976.1 3-isopropylmalate dehydrogenase [Vagococcus acidifermentans]